MNTRLKALDEIYKAYTYAPLGEKNRIENEMMKMYTNKKYYTYASLGEKNKMYTLLHLLNPKEKPPLRI